jgi:hypothetical protein
VAKPLVEVAISADGSVFVREVDKATGASEKFSSSVKKSGDTAKQTAKDVEGFGAEFGKAAKWVAASAAAAATGAALFVKSAIDTADAAGILAGKLDISTESLSKLQYAATLADVSQGALEGGLKKLSTTLTTALDPGSKVAKMFDALGLSVRELIELPADQQLGRIGDALGRVENSNMRAALAQRIFGKSSQELIPILAEGSDGIRKAGDELERFGGVISGDLAQRAGEFNDNLDRIKTAAGGLGLQVADQLLGPLNDLSNEILELAQQKENAEGIATFIEGIGRAVVFTVQAVANTGNVFRFLGEEIAALVGGPAIGDIERIDEAIANLQERLKPNNERGPAAGFVIPTFISDEERAKIEQDIERLKQMKRVSEDLIQMQVRAQQSAKAAADAQEKQGQSAGAAVAPTGRLAVSVQTLTQALQEETPEQKAAKSARESAAKAADEARKGLDELVQSKRIENALLGVSARDQARYRAQLQLTEIAARGNAVVTEEMRQELDALTMSTYDTTEATKAHEKAMQDAANAANPWADALEGAAQRIDSAFVDMWKNIGSGFDSFAVSLKESFKQLLAELAHMAITRPILMRIGAAFGLGGSSGAMASGGGGGFGFGGIGSIFSGAKNFLGGFKSGGLSGGIDALMGASSLSSNWLGNAMSEFRFALGDASRALGLDGLAGRFDAAGLKINTFGQSIVDFGANLGAGMAGNWAGNKLGQSLFGERKTTGVGGTVGGVIGSAWGPIGTAIGSFLGSLAENAIGKIFGTGDLVKWGKLGITTGGGSNIPTDGSALETVTAASGLTLTAVAKRTDAEAAKQLLEGFNAIDGALTAAARSAGITVDFANKVLGNTSLNVDNEGPNNSFGVGDRLDKFSADRIKGSADEFARAWLAEIDDQVSTRIKTVLGDTARKTADQIVSLFTAASDLDRLLKINVLEETAKAAEAASKTIISAYDEATQKVVDLASEYDGTAESLTTLNQALAEQKAIAVQLAEQYRQVALAVNDAFGNTISQIQDSLLSEADLYAKRRQQIADLTTELGTTIDPARIAAISDQINQLASAAYGLLDESQRAALGNEFVTFLENARDLATAQLTAGTDQLGSRETGLAGAVDLELMAQAAQTQQTAANTFANAVNTFAGIVGGNGISIDIEAILANLRAQGVEVNG